MEYKEKSQSIKRKVYILLSTVMILQVLIIGGVILFGGTIGEIKTNAADILNERVSNRSQYLQNEMVSRYADLTDTSTAINAIVANTLGDQTTADLGRDAGLDERTLAALNGELLKVIRRNAVSGAFVVLTGDDHTYTLAPGKTRALSALYLRTSEPGSTSLDLANFSVVRAPKAIATSLSDISVDSNWNPKLTLKGDDPQGAAFYTEPLVAAKENPGLSAQNVGYWAPAFTLDDDDKEIITYSCPLRDSAGQLYGVVGVELSNTYLKTLLLASELDPRLSASYVLGVSQGATKAVNVSAISGPAYANLGGNTQKLQLNTTAGKDNTYPLTNEDLSKKAVANVHALNLYQSNTPFEDQQWVLAGVESDDDLYAFADSVRNTIITAAFVAMILGFVAVIATGRTMSAPITSLVAQVRSANPRLPMAFKHTHISEIDELAHAIETANGEAVNIASKLSTIIDIAGVPIAAFEYNKDSREVFYTNVFFRLLGRPEIGVGHNYMDGHSFWQYLGDIGVNHLTPRPDMDTEELLEIIDDAGQPHWTSWKYLDDDKRLLGVIQDVTQETLEIRRAIHERDYDGLTGLLNRHAFHRHLEELFKNPSALHISAMLMLDLDNLKFINDTYGHDMGDVYIRSTAKVLKHNAGPNALVARQSGDEFYVFFYGYAHREEITHIVEAMREELFHTSFLLLQDPDLKIRASVGIAWYPDDATEFEVLQKYADFAMYQAKNNNKGTLCAYDSKTYASNIYLLDKSEALNRLLENNLVDYHFQPIVDVQDATVMGYELLMRSKLESLRSPLEILTLAKSQSKLQQIERLTWFNALAAARAHLSDLGNAHLFINSISNQCISQDDYLELSTNYDNLLSRVVLELTEEEAINEDATRCKVKMLDTWHAHLALDDYGTGYNGDANLLLVSPDYVKIDMSIIKGIDQDEKRRQLLCSNLSYLKDRHIKVIAEGVETAGELHTVIACGVDYVQGYYLGRPNAVPQRLNAQLTAEVLTAKDA